MTAPGDRRVDDLREQLRALGYLDARVDRFVLGGGRQRSALGLTASASARIGILTGALLGPAAVVGLRLRAPELVTSLADGVVITAYLAVLFAIATSVLAGLGIVSGSALARRADGRPSAARRLAGLAGLSVAIVTLLYLAFWWRAADPATGIAVLPTVAVLAVAAGISLLLGHAVTITILAWLAQSGHATRLAPGLPLSSWRAIFVLGLAGVGGGVAVLAATTGARPERPPDLVVVPTGERVLVLAIDGVDAATMARLDAAGRLPHLGRVFGAAATMPSSENRDPARVWTTIATGQPPERHGITGLESRQVAGVEGRFRPGSPLWTSLTAATDLLRLTQPAVATGRERRAPTFWEVGARAGLRTAVLHWWATWPAGADQGVVLTDRALLRLEQGGPLDSEIAPPELYATLEDGWTTRRARAQALVAEAFATAGPSRAADTVRRAAELDATLIGLATDPALGAPDLLVLYLPGLDIAQHALLGEGAALTPTTAAGRLASLEAYYEFLDRALGALLASPPGNALQTTLVVGVTQPGRISDAGDGLLGLSGPAAAQGDVRTHVTAVAATVLYALGVPVASDLAEGPAVAVFTETFRNAHRGRTVATYGPAELPPRGGSGRTLDREMIERMRSLGYLR